MSIEATLQRIERKLDRLNEPKPKWVRAGVITGLTGWGAQQMRRARVNNLLTWKDDHGLWYDLSSLHPYLLKNKA